MTLGAIGYDGVPQASVIERLKAAGVEDNAGGHRAVLAEQLGGRGQVRGGEPLQQRQPVGDLGTPKPGCENQQEQPRCGKAPRGDAALEGDPDAEG